MTASGGGSIRPAGFRAVVFDMDGVIVESEHLWEEMWAAFAADRSADWTRRQTTDCQGMSAPEWSQYLTDFAGGAESPAETERIVVDGMLEALDNGRIELLDGARTLVEDVSDLVPIAMASSATRRVIDAVLAHHGLTKRFTATVSSAEVPRGKPQPDVYREAASRLGVDPRACLAVEDSSNGLRAAAAADMTVVAIPNPVYAPAPDALALAASVAADHADIRRILLEALGRPETDY
ncbi:HAD family hydrolase [Spelaeicoccus albus]|uniref:HAD superfamily hydrolase (TIGR01509 family) n=1 Tax=Spelaeicoccus albus TaxID=1280376 RepID=A0A7Z0A9C7_9MICO|nr:HAD family phosphatase [Spelaeicoccus albus]NYI66001.1 HAD superfamily hydrolase (TIGR01509 family) [Spelaeicoccus albus]